MHYPQHRGKIATAPTANIMTPILIIWINVVIVRKRVKSMLIHMVGQWVRDINGHRHP